MVFQSLCSLDISNVHLKADDIDAEAFSNLDELQFLQIHQNDFHEAKNPRYPDIQLSKLRSLKYLKIDIFNGFQFQKPFENLINLTKLEFNTLGEFKITNTSFDGLKLSPLRSLDMKFRYHVDCDVSEDLFCSFPFLDTNITINFGGKCSVYNLSIHLKGNPISCACLNIQSLKWMKNHQISFPDLGKVLCVENNHHVGHLFNIEIWRKFELDCQPNDWLIFSIVLLFLIMLIFTSIAAIKRYRVHLEYVILRLKKQWKGIPLRKSEDEFLFDVYVSYSESDYEWVRDKLRPKLEDLNVKSWITDINSTPGRWVLEGIVNRINECRKVMFVVSESFLDMEWSSYAVKTAITHAFHNQRQGFIVVLIKDGVALEKLPEELKNIWWCIEYFRWPDEEESNEVILKKLAKTLKSDITV
nr:toll-like receptor 2 type-1 [Crassostrea gigas]